MLHHLGKANELILFLCSCITNFTSFNASVDLPKKQRNSWSKSNLYLPSVHGNWADWASWGSCTVTCGGGTKDRSRTCTNPAPQYLGNDCVGSGADRTDCNTHHCPSKLTTTLKVNSHGLKSKLNATLNVTRCQKKLKRRILKYGHRDICLSYFLNEIKSK